MTINIKLSNGTQKLVYALIFSFSSFAPAGAFAAAINDRTEAAQRSARTMEAEELLTNLGYWVTMVDGASDASTRHAIMAFQKGGAAKKDGCFEQASSHRFEKRRWPTPKYQGEAHLEIDITRQILFLVGDEGQVSHVLPVSTGSGEKYFSQGKWQKADTPRGSFRITRQIKGVRKAPLGTIYYPSYFHEGWAIHGSNSIPAKPASHGCARIPRFAEKHLSNLVRVGMPVYVYD